MRLNSISGARVYSAGMCYDETKPGSGARVVVLGVDIEIHIRGRVSTDRPMTHEGHWSDNYFRPMNLRYYSEGDPRGHWPDIATILIDLMNDPDIEAVWYCSDTGYGPEEDEPPITMERVVELTRHFAQNRDTSDDL